jgi:hypothetical protein
MPRLASLVFVAALLTAGLAAPVALGAQDESGDERDPWFRPFRSDSMWNTPIGSGAEYVPAELPSQPRQLLDRVLLVRTDASDPVRPLIEPRNWDDRCAGTNPTGIGLHVPDDWLVSDARPGEWTPNYVAAFLQPDGRTIVNTNAVARCEEAGPVYGYWTGNDEIDITDLYGDGRLGSHGASRLSGLGGAIRPGELSGDVEIRHALDVLVPAEYLWFDGEDTCYRWPARDCDSYADWDTYTGWVPDLRMGSLLALEPDLEPDDLGIRTEVGERLFTAFQDYGAYVTDDSNWDAFYLSVDDAAVDTFDWGDDEQADFDAIMVAASVVANNDPDNVGGGGTPRREPLPELVDPDAPPPPEEPDGPGAAQDAPLSPPLSPDVPRVPEDQAAEFTDPADNGWSPWWLFVASMVVAAGGVAAVAYRRRSSSR